MSTQDQYIVSQLSLASHRMKVECPCCGKTYDVPCTLDSDAAALYDGITHDDVTVRYMYRMTALSRRVTYDEAKHAIDAMIVDRKLPFDTRCLPYDSEDVFRVEHCWN